LIKCVKVVVADDADLRKRVEIYIPKDWLISLELVKSPDL
jgi:hypothetical protein